MSADYKHNLLKFMLRTIKHGLLSCHAERRGVKEAREAPAILDIIFHLSLPYPPPLTSNEGILGAKWKNEQDDDV